ncbi:MAG: hypothetical protein K2O31_01795 [Clostridia bacterium]|nr:hypothetical protein [Clostridia bacterium]MDE6604614.1 hypothetical protein [Clostridia bacterium]MDE7208592.1 hypothetical protein [Clostridia bacterium]
MKVQVAMCPCGQSVKIDIEKKFGYCEYCGSQVFLTRDDIMGSDIVRNDMDLAVKYFKEKDIKGAVRYAEEVLAYVPDNAIGLFITSFNRCFMAETKYKDALKVFFSSNVAGTLERNELNQLLTITRLSLPYLADCESEVIRFAMSSGNKTTVESFVEGYLPFAIGKRVGSSWLDSKLKENYIRLASEYDTPKTMFALYKALTDNVDSPERKENYGMISLMKNFIDGFCVDIGEIFEAISNSVNKEKFVKAYKAKMSALNKIYQSESERMKKFKNGF